MKILVITTVLPQYSLHGLQCIAIATPNKLMHGLPYREGDTNTGDTAAVLN